MYEGTVTGNVRVDTRKKQPKIKINNSLTGIQINPLLSDFSGNEKLLGRGSVNVALQMNELGAPRVKETLNGSIDVNLNNGADKGLGAIKTTCSVGRKLETLLTGGNGELEQAGDTEFPPMSAKFVFVDSVATNDHLDLKSPLLRAHGSGSANLLQALSAI